MPGNFVLVMQRRPGAARSRAKRQRQGASGDYVTLLTKLGEVGNSGNSNEPHLHIHAQRPGLVWDPFIGDPLPIRLDGRYPVRNDRVVIVGPFGGDEGDEID
jgi:hypothetical protein